MKKTLQKKNNNKINYRRKKTKTKTNETTFPDKDIDDDFLFALHFSQKVFFRI